MSYGLRCFQRMNREAREKKAADFAAWEAGKLNVRVDVWIGEFCVNVRRNVAFVGNFHIIFS